MASLKNVTINDTGHITIPKGTTAQRPGTSSAGMIRYNTETGVTEYYNGTKWVNILTGEDVVTSGLVLWLDAGQTRSYPGSGTTWYDLSGNGNNGTLTNGPTYSSTNGGDLIFDGADDYISINSTNMNFASNQTIFIILKPEEADANRRNPYNQAYGGYGTITHEPAGTFSYYHGTNGADGSPWQGTGSTFTVGQNEIAAITLVRDPANVSWYKNGVFSNSSANSYPTAVSSVITLYLAER